MPIVVLAVLLLVKLAREPKKPVSLVFLVLLSQVVSVPFLVVVRTVQPVVDPGIRMCVLLA